MPARAVSLYGDTAVLIECAAGEAADLALACRRAFPELLEACPADSSVLLQFAGQVRDLPTIARRIDDLDTSAAATQRYPDITLSVTYDGVDLAAVAATTGLSVGEVIHRHSQASYRVAFCGFAPGFAYLVGVDPALVLPRRQSPRQHVPAGSVAIAANYSAIYPRPSPGGWHILGSCDAELFNPEADQPALLVPGTSVRFEVS